MISIPAFILFCYPFICKVYLFDPPGPPAAPAAPAGGGAPRLPMTPATPAPSAAKGLVLGFGFVLHVFVWCSLAKDNLCLDARKKFYSNIVFDISFVRNPTGSTVEVHNVVVLSIHIKNNGFLHVQCAWTSVAIFHFTPASSIEPDRSQHKSLPLPKQVEVQSRANVVPGGVVVPNTTYPPFQGIF